MNLEQREEPLGNIKWKGRFNLYSKILKKLEGHIVEDDETFAASNPSETNVISRHLFEKIEDIYVDLSEQYLENRIRVLGSGIDDSNPYLRQLSQQLGNLYDNFNRVTIIDPRDEYGFAFRDDECELITKFVEDRLFQGDLSLLSDIAFDNWRRHCKLGSPDDISFGDDGERSGDVCVPHISHANDFFGKEIYHQFENKIQTGDKIRILDLGAGTGGTTEAVVNWIYTEAKRNGYVIQKDQLEVVGVEFNESLADDFDEKSKNLSCKYEGVNITGVKDDMAEYVSAVSNSDTKYDAIVASYSMHHLKRDVRRKLMGDAYDALTEDGIFLRADPNGGKSEINRHYFNFTDEGTFASFDIGKVSAEDLCEAGFDGIDVLKNKEYIDKMKGQLDNSIVEKLIDDYGNNSGYISVGLRGHDSVGL